MPCESPHPARAGITCLSVCSCSLIYHLWCDEFSLKVSYPRSCFGRNTCWVLCMSSTLLQLEGKQMRNAFPNNPLARKYKQFSLNSSRKPQIAVEILFPWSPACEHKGDAEGKGIQLRDVGEAERHLGWNSGGQWGKPHPFPRKKGHQVEICHEISRRESQIPTQIWGNLLLLIPYQNNHEKKSTRTCIPPFSSLAERQILN